MCPHRVFTELSEVSRSESPQNHYFADICVTAVMKGLRRVRKNEIQTNLMGNPLNNGMALFLTISYVSDTASTKAVTKYQTSLSVIFYQNAN